MDNAPVRTCFLFLLGVSFFASSISMAQTVGSVEGLVRDVQTNTPIPGAHIYLAHTALGTTTDSSGAFFLENIPRGTYTLATSILGYSAESITIQIDEAPQESITLTLQPTIYELGSLEVSEEKPRDWERNYKRFEDLFLGKSAFARSTRIINPYVLEFNHDRVTSQFSARASEPLIIENEALGYILTYDLLKFSWDPFEERYIQVGLPRFSPMEPDTDDVSQRWEKNRQRAWEGSLPHLMQAMILGTSFEEGFHLTERTPNNSRPVDDRDLLMYNPLSKGYQIMLPGLLDVRAQFLEGRGLIKRRSASYHYQLDAIQDHITIDKDGYISPPEAIQTQGYPKRIAELLPREYALDQYHRAAPKDTTSSLHRVPTDLIPLRDWYYVGSEWENGSWIRDTSIAMQQAHSFLDLQEWKQSVRTLTAILEHQPDHYEARYYRGIAYREIANTLPYIDASYVQKTIDDDWTRATNDFEWIIERNPSYRDVFYQYAILKGYARKYKEAIELGDRQLQERPSMSHVVRGIFKIHAAFLYDNLRGSQDWFVSQDTDRGRYFNAEALRLQDNCAEAIPALESLLVPPVTIPYQPLYLTLAQCHYAKGDYMIGQNYIERAISTVRTKDEADFVFDLIVFIATTEEWERYRKLDSGMDLRNFFSVFWTSRNPLPSLPWDERMAEHFRRIAHAEQHYGYNERRIWTSMPEFSSHLQFPPTYLLSDRFNDKGVVFIRHGEPDDRVIQITPYTSVNKVTTSGELNLPDDMFTFTQPVNESDGVIGAQQMGYKPNESWRYNHPNMDFHFVTEGGGGWRLVPMFPLTESAIMEREQWSGYYGDLAMETMRRARGIGGGVDNFSSAYFNLEDRSRQNVLKGLQTDQHTWSSQFNFFEFDHVISTFKDTLGYTRLHLDYALPISEISMFTSSDSPELSIEQGCSIHDRTWKEIDHGLTVQNVLRNDDPNAFIVGSCQFSLLPNNYHISLHTRLRDSHSLGGYTLDTKIPAYTEPKLDISDILPALSIEEATFPSRFNKGSYHVRPNPTSKFSVAHPAYFYVEVYNLTTSDDALTSYSLEIELLEQKRILGLFGRKTKPILSLKTTNSGDELHPVETLEIDLQDVAAGSYQLVIKVTDELIGITVEKARQIELKN